MPSPHSIKGYLRPQWLSFVAACVLLFEFAVLSQLASEPWGALCGGLALTGSVIVNARRPGRQ